MRVLIKNLIGKIWLLPSAGDHSNSKYLGYSAMNPQGLEFFELAQENQWW